MLNGPADNSPHCPRCGSFLYVHGCTAGRCENPGGVVTFEGKHPTPEGAEAARELGLLGGFTPPGYVSIASTGADVQASRVCGCDRCVADGAHEPMCAVHWEPPKACNCGNAGQPAR